MRPLLQMCPPGLGTSVETSYGKRTGALGDVDLPQRDDTLVPRVKRLIALQDQTHEFVSID